MCGYVAATRSDLCAALQLIANTGGVGSLVSVMRQHAGSDSITCNGCLALMSLVRGEGEVCQSNQWHVAKAGAIEVIAKAMERFRWVQSHLPYVLRPTTSCGARQPQLHSVAWGALM
jgi:hypothetical protein